MSIDKFLGKGLASLMPVANDVENSAVHKDKSDYFEINISDIYPSSLQPRGELDTESLYELAESIKKHGLLHPIILNKKDGKYFIVAGERRWRAYKIIGLKTIRALVGEYEDKESSEIAIVENVQRQNLSTLDEAKAYIRLIDEFGYTHEQIAQRIGKSRSYIVNTIRITRLPIEILKLLQEKKITAGHARALLSHDNPIEYADEIVRKGLTVRDVERDAKNSRARTVDKSNVVSERELDELSSIIDALKAFFKLDVSAKCNSDGSGFVALHFKNIAELDSVFDNLFARVRK